MSLRGRRLTIVGKALDDPDVRAETVGAWSVSTRLKRTYTGPACRIRRVSDDQEQDIGFVGGNLDFNAVRDFCGASIDARVVTVYDQMGGNDLVQSTQENQPQLQPQGGSVRQLSSPQVLGGEVFSASSQLGGNAPSLAFDGSYAGVGYHTRYPRYNTATGAYTGSVSTIASGTTINGEWLQIQFPQPIRLERFSLSPRSTNLQRVPSTWSLVGSTDGSTWTLLGRTTGIVETEYAASFDTMFYMNTSGVYSHIRIIFESIFPSANSDSVQITQFKIWGTPQEDLDGSVRLTGGYMVPTSHNGSPTLKYTVYNGYFADNVSFFDSATVLNEGYVTSVSNISVGTNAYMPVNGGNLYSVQWLGFFKATESGSWTFYTESDDASYLWVGSSAWKGYTVSNALAEAPGTHPMTKRSGTIDLSKDTVYPIRIQFGESGGGDNCIISVTPPGGTETTDLGLFLVSPALVTPAGIQALSGPGYVSSLMLDTETLYMLPGSVEENPNLGSAVLQTGAGNEGPYELDGYVVEASSTWSGTLAHQVILAFNKTNSNHTDCWHSADIDPPHWIQITYPYSTHVASYSVTSRNGFDQRPGSWTLQGSNDDGVTWSTIDIQNNQGAQLLPVNTTYNVQIGQSEAYKSFRLYITETTSNRFVAIGQWRVFTTPNPGLGKLLAKNTLATQTVSGQIRVPTRMPVQAMSYQDLVSLISVSRRDLVVNAGKTSITDQVDGVGWGFNGNTTYTLEDNIPCLDITTASNVIRYSSTALGNAYTAFFYWKSVPTTEHKSLLRMGIDHTAFILSGTQLGVYSNRDGGWRTTGYVVPQNVWMTLVVVGIGTGESSFGTSTFYVDDQLVGTCDRVASGSGQPDTSMRIGADTQSPPGHLAVAGLFNRALSRREITKMHRIMSRWGQGGFDVRVPRAIGRTYSEYLPVRNGLVGWYTGSSFVNNVWQDRSGQGNHVTEITGTVIQSTKDGNVPILSGGTSTSLVWPTSILPSTYTLFHVARYTPGGRRLRIFSGYDQNWLSGFHSNKTGVAYHRGWLNVVSQYPLDQWLMSTDQNNLYRGNGVDFTTGSPGPISYARLTINSGLYNETSDWEVAEVIVFDRSLSLGEIEAIETYLDIKYQYMMAESLKLQTRLQADAQTLSGSAVSTWGDFTTAGATAPQIVSESYVSFDTTQSQYLDAGPQAFVLSGGFTIMALVKFKSTNLYEKIVEFGNGTASDNLILSRSGTTTSVYIEFWNGNVGNRFVVPDIIEDKEWVVIAGTYSYANTTYSIYKDGQFRQSKSGVPQFTDRTLGQTWIGRSSWTADAYTDQDLKYLGIWETELTGHQIKQMTSYLRTQYL